MRANEIFCDVNLVYVAPIVCGGSMVGPCFVIQYYLWGLSSCGIIFMWKRELVTLYMVPFCSSEWKAREIMYAKVLMPAS